MAGNPKQLNLLSLVSIISSIGQFEFVSDFEFSVLQLFTHPGYPRHPRSIPLSGFRFPQSEIISSGYLTLHLPAPHNSVFGVRNFSGEREAALR
jgi:hypothetical protein